MNAPAPPTTWSRLCNEWAPARLRVRAVNDRDLVVSLQNDRGRIARLELTVHVDAQMVRGVDRQAADAVS
jgi:hypothetical protein